MSSTLPKLAQLVHQKNAVDGEIATIIARPALLGHVGEYIAAQVFDIKLEHSASNKSVDGYFTAGPLAGRSVNVKWFTKHDGLLNMSPEIPPDYYLVLAGPRSPPMSSRGGVRPWMIEFVFLFDASELVTTLQGRGTRIGVATSVPASFWKAAELYPEQRNIMLKLSEEQRTLLAMFH